MPDKKNDTIEESKITAKIRQGAWTLAVKTKHTTPKYEVGESWIEGETDATVTIADKHWNDHYSHWNYEFDGFPMEPDMWLNEADISTRLSDGRLRGIAPPKPPEVVIKKSTEWNHAKCPLLSEAWAPK